VTEALERLNYEEAHKTVVDETAIYAHRLPGIEKLTFSDGTPFADDVTQGWLKEISLERSPDTDETVVISRYVPGDSEEAQIAEVYNQAGNLVKQKKIIEGVELIQEYLNRGIAQKSRFLWRIALIRVLLNAKKARLALPHLWDILNDIEKHNLDCWDPDLVLEALTEVHKSLKVQPDKELQDRAMETMDHIARLNPVAALRLTKE
jgi:type VI secretion system protein VasJ